MYQALQPHLELIACPLKQMLYQANQPIDYVYFPESGVMSIVQLMEDGSAVEIGTVGNEGMVGVPVFLGTDRTPSMTFAQVPGEALRLTVPVFHTLLKRYPELQRLLQRYTQAFLSSWPKPSLATASIRFGNAVAAGC